MKTLSYVHCGNVCQLIADSECVLIIEDLLILILVLGRLNLWSQHLSYITAWYFLQRKGLCVFFDHSVQSYYVMNTEYAVIFIMLIYEIAVIKI